MGKLARFLNSPLTQDLIFGVMGLGSLAALLAQAGRGVPAIAAAEQPLRVGATMVGVLVAAAVVATSSSRLDRAKDEYVYRLLSRSALIAMIALVLATTLWFGGLEENLGELSGPQVLALGLGAWSLGYLYVRIKGTAE